MRYRAIAILLFAFVFLTSGPFAPDPVLADVITIVADEWPPYNCEPGDDEPGYVVELAQKIFGAAGHEVRYEVLPWTRAVRYTAAGRFNAVIGGTRCEAPGFVFPKQEVGLSVNHFFVRKGSSWRFTSYQNLHGMRVAVVKDYDYGPRLNAFIKKNKSGNAVQVATGEAPLEMNIKKLLHDRVDVVVEDKNVFMYTAKAMGARDKIAYAGNDEHFGDHVSDFLYLAFSPDNPKSEEYAAIWDQGLAAMRANGELAVILANYGLEDWR